MKIKNMQLGLAGPGTHIVAERATWLAWDVTGARQNSRTLGDGAGG